MKLFLLRLQQVIEALKYLIHLVGDAHQPMHVSRKEDKGGNTIQLRLDGKTIVVSGKVSDFKENRRWW